MINAPTERHVPIHVFAPDGSGQSCSKCGLPPQNRHHHGGRTDGRDS